MSRRVAWLGLLPALGLVACFERGNDDDEASGAEQERAEPAAVSVDPPPAEREPDPDATVRLALEAEPPHLNPLLAGDAIANRITMGDVYEGLACADAPGAEVEPCLAESIAMSDDGRTITARLRDDVRFHDGHPLTAGDVVFTYEILRRGTPPSWLAADFDDLRAVKARDEHTVTLRFAGSRPGRRQALSRVPVLPEHVFAGEPAELAAHPANRAPVGTGPLRFAGWKPGERIVLERFDEYRGAPARAARIAYVPVTGRQQALARLEAGAIDVVLQVPIDQALEAAEAPDVRAFEYSLPAYLAAVYNLRREPLERARVRRALAMLMDRAGMARELFAGRAPIVTGPFLPGAEQEDPDVEPLPFDRERAGALLGDEPPELTALVPAGSRTMRRLADVWADDARPHARLSIEPIPYAALLARVREGRFDVALMAFTSGRDVDLYNRFHSSQRGAENYGAVADGTLDRLLAAVRAEADRERRAELQRRVHRRLHELQPYTFILGDARMGLARSEVGGLGAPGYGLAARYLWKSE